LALSASFFGLGLCLQDRDVVILTDENFDQTTLSGVWMIDIYAPRYAGRVVNIFLIAPVA